MNIINTMTEQKEKCYLLKEKNNIWQKFPSALLISIAFVAGFVFLANSASADDSSFEIPACSFEEQEGRTIASFGDKKIVSHWSQEDAESGPVAVSIPAGSYKVSLFSYDGYESRAEAFPQPKESWFAVLKNGDSVITQSSAVDDLEDWVQSATKTQVVNEDLAVDEDIDSVLALNAGYPDESSPNSVFPVCAAFDLIKLKEEPNHSPVITLIGSTTVNLIIGDIFTDPGATANDQEDGDITDDIIIGGDVVNTNVAGTYVIAYNVSDSQGKAADEATRTVIVAESSGGGGGSSSSSSSESSSSSSSENGGGGGGGVGGDSDESVSVGGGSGRISFGGSRIILPPTSSTASSTSAPEESSSSSLGQCSYLKDYLKFGENNDPAEVLKLQAFLRLYEKIEAPLTGVFDKATFDAVSVFQERYKEDILAPWGYETSTGYVYITTKNKINEIFCNSEIPLSDEQKIEIEKVRNFIEEFGRNGGSGDSGSQGVGGDIGNADGGAGEGSEGIESDYLAAGVGFIKSPMAFILDNKLTVIFIGLAITLLIYMFSFRGSKV